MQPQPYTALRSVKLDVSQIIQLASVGMTNQEIAQVAGIDMRTLHRRFRIQLEQGRNQMKLSLRRAQLTRALDGNVPMLIWLGKQYLDQRERTEVSGDQNAPIRIQPIDYRQGLTALAPPSDSSTGSDDYSYASSEGEDIIDGETVGEDDTW